MPEQHIVPYDAEHLQDCLLTWSRLWRVPQLATFARVHRTRRLRTSIGRCYPKSGDIFLSIPLLERYPDELVATLCHEAAHIAVYLRFGTRPRPHGPEWKELMRVAGFPAERVLRVQGTGERGRGGSLPAGSSQQALPTMTGGTVATALEAALAA